MRHAIVTRSRARRRGTGQGTGENDVESEDASGSDGSGTENESDSDSSDSDENASGSEDDDTGAASDETGRKRGGSGAIGGDDTAAGAGEGFATGKSRGDDSTGKARRTVTTVVPRNDTDDAAECAAPSAALRAASASASTDNVRTGCRRRVCDGGDNASTKNGDNNNEITDNRIEADDAGLGRLALALAGTDARTLPLIVDGAYCRPHRPIGLVQMARARADRCAATMCAPTSYVRLAQMLIERCLLHYLSEAECIVALKMQANIEPGMTQLVFRRVEMQNRAFFARYWQRVYLRQRVASMPVRPWPSARGAGGADKAHGGEKSRGSAAAAATATEVGWCRPPAGKAGAVDSGHTAMAESRPSALSCETPRSRLRSRAGSSDGGRGA